MNLKKLILTNNACYKAGRKITPKGIMVHSTGANNPNLRRYVGPDDGFLGKNKYNNHWNQDRPSGRQVCVHAFIGKLADGTIATYQTLPWDHRGWHAGGAANDTHIGFEICEDDLTDRGYFNLVYKEAVELCAYLCRMYKISVSNIIGHFEGHQRRIATNHADPRHWFSRFGKNMDTFRADVKSELNAGDKKPAGIGVGSIVEIKSSAFRYYPGGPVIPAWVKTSYHKVTQDKFSGRDVFKGKKRCVLLGRRVDKISRQESPGIMTWVDLDELEIVAEQIKEQERTFYVQVGGLQTEEEAKRLQQRLIAAGFKEAVVKK